MASFINSLNLSIISESELSNTFNILAFNIITYATAGDLTSGKDIRD
jgi:hypothetical protein